MQIIPAINEIDFEEIKKKILAAESFGAEWVHLDIADGKFTPNLLWNSPKDLDSLHLKPLTLNLNIEVHLMVENPEDVLEDWLVSGIKRIFIHYESMSDFRAIKERCGEAGVELGLAIGPHIPVEGLFEYKRKVSYFLILAVEPGISGQKFSAGDGSSSGGQDNQLEKIKLLREKMPNVKIEVDGGINIYNAFDIKQAGADILVSASYIWNSKNPEKAFELLKDA